MSAYLEIARSLESAGSDVETAPQEAEPEADHQAVNEGIVIIDFGSQYSHLIARRIRELKVYSEIVPSKGSWSSIEHINPKGVILTGGPASVFEPGAPTVPDWVFEKNLPVLGICYGMQALVHQLGGRVAPGLKQEFGSAVLHQNAADGPIFQDMPPSFQVWMSHGDRVEEMPPGFSALATPRTLRLRPSATGMAFSACNSTRKSNIPRWAGRFWKTFFSRLASARAHGRPGIL